MAQTQSQRKASDQVAAWLAAHQKNYAWLVDATGADPGTIGDFLNGNRWPKTGTQGKIERALGWPSGSIRQIGNGSDPDEVGAVLADPSSVGATTQDEASPQGDSLLFQRPPGLSDDQWAQIRDDMGEYLELEIRRASRQR